MLSGTALQNARVNGLIEKKKGKERKNGEKNRKKRQKKKRKKKRN